MSLDLHAGSQFSEYRIERILGRGGMAVVYLAEHVPLQRKVALKLLASDLAGDRDFRARFVRESRVAASIDHPNIIPIYAAGEVDGVLYIAMRYVEGTDLKQRIETQGPLTLGHTVWLLTQVAGALDAAHNRGLVHRDVKPANVLIAEGAGAAGLDHCYLTDFGVTKQAMSNTGLTKTGHFVGTLDYVAPEQIQGKPLDGRADVYALGCVLYECLAGTRPFRRDSEVALMYAHLQEPPPPLSSVRPDLPPGLDRVIARGMAKSPADRYPNCYGLIRAAEEELPPGVRLGARPPMPVPPPPETGPSWAPTESMPSAPRAPAVATAPTREAPAPGAPTGAGRGGRKALWIGLGAAAAVVVALVLVLLLRHAPETTTTGAAGSPTASATSPSTPGTPSVGPSVPDARTVPLDTILRPGTVADRVMYTDLNGDGIKEIILSSHAKAGTAIGGHQPFLDVWSYTGQQFQRVFDGTVFTPQIKGAPAALIASSQDVASQEVSWLDIVDFQGDGTPELVAGITSFGASVGPMDVWVLSMGQSGFKVEFYEQTTQGGTLTRDGDTEKLETPFFRPSDPLCCPSKIEHQVIAWNQTDQQIEVTSTTFTKP